MAAKNETALDRLERTKLPSNEREFTLEEQMDSVSTDDFLDGMSDVAKDNLGHLFEEVTVEEEYSTEEPVVESQPVLVTPVAPVQEMPMAPVAPVAVEPSESSDELFNNNNEKPRRKYRKHSEESSTADQTPQTPMSGSSNPVLDQLAKDVIDDLRSKRHKINRFDDKSMEMIFNYMYNKF